MKQRKWDSTDIIDQNGNIVIVTGGSSGIGLETARVLASKNATTIIAVRNLEKGEEVRDMILENFSKADIRIMQLDLANLSSILTFTEKFKTTFSRLDLLINNAGVMIPPYQKTADGFELQMGTNHLGHFALTGMLINLIKKTKKSRIVNVSSMAHKAGNINFNDLHWENRTYKKWRAYGDSKLANLYFTFSLQKRLEKENAPVIVAAAHPGYTATKLQRYMGIFSVFNHVLAQDIPMGALPTLYAATADDVKTGQFFGPSGFMEMKGHPKRVVSNTISRDMQTAEKLWKLSEKLTGVTY